jgi:prolyl oligopeptidase
MRLVLTALLIIGGQTAQAGTGETKDPFRWLEQVESPRALDWVKAEDARSLKILQADPRYQGFYDQALALTQAADRIPTPGFTAGQITNFWQDAAHVQGIWRRTSPASYRSAQPDWQIVLDLDALSKAEHTTWVWKGASCFRPDDKSCLVSLSDGGEDAVTTREFDFSKAVFRQGGFLIPRAKQVADWETADTILLGTDWGPGSMTASGYPFIIKRLRRGQPLAEAQEVFRGTPQDVAVEINALSDAQGHRAVVLQRGLDFFRTEFRLVTGSGTTRLNLPEKAEIEGLVDNQLIVKLNEDFAYAGAPVQKAGTLVALDMAHPGSAPAVMFVPNARQAIAEAGSTAHRVIATVLDNVRGRAMVFSPNAGAWSARTLTLPDNAGVSLVATNDVGDEAFLEVTSFLQPTSLYLADAAISTPPAEVKSLPPKFDASGEVTEQFEATSTDGTKIPYFVVHPKTMTFDGSNPTWLYAYGGYQISMTPKYDPVLGKLWLERGGVYVLANIRGGGEFGPAWHEAGLKTKRQIIYDDFAAIAKDLIARRITSPARLGIRGGSNGGLLMGVEFEQHPELWHAVIIEVPLLDMLRFEKIAAGASWVGEYGSTSNPAERAFLAGISPYANLKPGVAYPEPFIFTTTKDDRVGPAHARKFAALMESMKLPFFYYEAIEGGHAAGANLQQKAEEQALEMTYLTGKLISPQR